MRLTKTLIAAAAAACLAPVVSTTAAAQPRDYGWHDSDDRWDPSQHWDHRRHHERRLGREDEIYRGGDGRYYCKRSDGSTGLVVGALAGGLIGNAASHNTLGTLIGVAGGAALGDSIDRGRVRCR